MRLRPVQEYNSYRDILCFENCEKIQKIICIIYVCKYNVYILCDVCMNFYGNLRILSLNLRQL